MSQKFVWSLSRSCNHLCGAFFHENLICFHCVSVCLFICGCIQGVVQFGQQHCLAGIGPPTQSLVNLVQTEGCLSRELLQLGVTLLGVHATCKASIKGPLAQKAAHHCWREVGPLDSNGRPWTNVYANCVCLICKVAQCMQRRASNTPPPHFDTKTVSQAVGKCVSLACSKQHINSTSAPTIPPHKQTDSYLGIWQTPDKSQHQKALKGCMYRCCAKGPPQNLSSSRD